MPSTPSPNVIVMAGPNGAGKSTAGPTLVRDTLGVTEFVDADVMAKTLLPSDPAKAAIQAGRHMLKRLRELAGNRISFAFETTLASRSFAPWLDGLLRHGWRCDLVFLWLPSPDLAVARVRDRIRLGGHTVAEEVVRRRYRGGLRNFFALYRPLATSWRLYDNSGAAPRLIASGSKAAVAQLADRGTWERISSEFGHA